MSQVQEPNFEGEEMKIPEGQEIIPTEASVAEVQASVSAPVLVVLTIILLAILGGLGYWYYLVTTMPLLEPVPTRPTAEQNREPESDTVRARTEASTVVSTSDEITALEADIEATNLDDLDTEMNAIEAELNSALEAL